MRVDVYGEDTERVLRLRLRRVSTGVVLSAVYVDGGTHSPLLTITDHGHTILHTCIDPAVGLALNERGQLQIDD